MQLAGTVDAHPASRGVRDCGTLEVGIDAYYKIANDLIDNGNFGQALVLSAFNYAKGYNKGVELKAKFTSGNFQAYVNFAAAQQRATDVVSNQYLFDNTTPLADLGGLTEFQYIQTSLHLHGSHPDFDRLRGPILSLEWHPVQHRHVLRQRPAQRRRQHRP